MNKNLFIKSLVVERHSDRELGETVVSFSSKCPWFAECGHSDQSVSHYGEEFGAKDAVINNILIHVQRQHGVKFDAEPPKEDEDA